jgi:hypothetical protein
MVDRKISNYVQEEKVAPTKPKVNAFNRRYQQKKAKAINKAKGEKKSEINNTPAKASPTSVPPENKEGVAYEDSIVRVLHSRTGLTQD